MPKINIYNTAVFFLLIFNIFLPISYVLILLISIITLIKIITESRNLDKFFTYFLLLGLFAMIMSLHRGELISVVNFLGFIIFPIFFDILSKNTLNKKYVLFCIVVPGMLVSLIYAFYISTLLPGSSNQINFIANDILSIILRPFSSGSLTSSDLILYIISSVFIISAIIKKSFLKFMLLFLLFLAVIFSGKSIAIIALAIYFISYLWLSKYPKFVWFFIFVFINAIPFVIFIPDIIYILNDPIFNEILSKRGVIWSSAFSYILDSSNLFHTFLIGTNQNPYVPVDYSIVGTWHEVSFHSAYLRLFISNGYLMYFFSINLLFIYLKNIYSKLQSSLRSPVLSYILFISILWISDGSVLTGMTWVMTLIPIPLLISMTKNTKQI